MFTGVENHGNEYLDVVSPGFSLEYAGKTQASQYYS